MDVRNRIGIAFMMCALLATSAARAEQFDFEDLAVGATVTTQYAPRGLVLFSNYMDTHRMRIRARMSCVRSRRRPRCSRRSRSC